MLKRLDIIIALMPFLLSKYPLRPSLLVLPISPHQAVGVYVSESVINVCRVFKQSLLNCAGFSVWE